MRYQGLMVKCNFKITIMKINEFVRFTFSFTPLIKLLHSSRFTDDSALVFWYSKIYRGQN